MDPADSAQPRPLLVALVTHREALVAYVGRQLPAALRSTVEPADVVHDVCYEALRRESEFQGGGTADAGRRWLFTVARHRIIRLAERRRGARQNPAEEDPLVLLLGELAVYERTPSQSAVSHETWAAVARSMGRLSPAHAEVIRCRYLERLPAAEVAARTNRTPDAVEKLLRRAMGALRHDLRNLILAHA